MPFIRSPFHSPAVSPSIQLGSSVLDPEAATIRPPLIRDILHSPQMIPSLPCLLKDKVCGVSSFALGVIRKCFKNVLKKTDVGSLVSLYQSREYLEMEHQASNLQAFQKHIKGFLDKIQETPGISDAKKIELERLSSKLLSNMDRLSVKGGQWFKKSVFSIFSIGLCILPLLTAYKNQNNQYFSSLVAGYAKTIIMMFGLFRNPTTDLGSLLLHLKERHIPYMVPSIPYVFTAYNAHVKQFEEKHVWSFAAFSSLFSGSIFLATSAPQLFYKPVVRIFDQVKRLALGAASPVGQQQLSDEVSHQVRGLFESVRQEMNAFSQRKADFETQGHALSDVLSTQTIDIQKSYQQLEKTVFDLLGEQREPQLSKLNLDFKQKLAFTVLAATLCIGTAATYYDEPMGLVDFSVDAALTSGEMLKTTFSAAETTQRAAEKFANYSGMAPFLLPFGAINKIKATHFTDNMAGLVTGIVLLTGAYLLLPRVTSEALTKALLSQFSP